MDLYPETIALINKYAKETFDLFGYKEMDRFEKGMQLWKMI